MFTVCQTLNLSFSLQLLYMQRSAVWVCMLRERATTGGQVLAMRKALPHVSQMSPDVVSVFPQQINSISRNVRKHTKASSGILHTEKRLRVKKKTILF